MSQGPKGRCVDWWKNQRSKISWHGPFKYENGINMENKLDTVLLPPPYLSNEKKFPNLVRLSLYGTFESVFAFNFKNKINNKWNVDLLY
jgi:hypothetical protein